MATFELILLLTLAVLISSIVDQVVPKISLPLIQIALGLIIASLAITPIEISIEPDLFLVLFIAPLLFSDAISSNKKNLWSNKFPILSFAIGLVVAITLCVGFLMHWLIPSIPLAAAFALGAALGPTDAVAVQALRKEAQLGKREGAILQGEALINDASGVVSFQFAIAAALTGTFSLFEASASFVINFVGGIAFGILLAFIFLFISSRVHNLGLENITFHVMFEVFMPFVTFLTSEIVGVSGILAVVACGLVWSMYNDRKISPYRSSLNIALSSVWSVVGFVLNGVVFVLLGMQLPSAMQSIWNNYYISNFALIGYVLIITLLIVGLRWLWALITIRLTKNPDTGKRDKISKKSIRTALVTTVGGPKGAITLSIVFSIPFLLSDGVPFPQRSLIIFLASGVILCTLLIANFALPVLAPRDNTKNQEDEEEFVLTRIEILRTVIERLIAQSKDDTDSVTQIVVASYNNRINAIRESQDIEHPSSTKLRIQVINHQANCLMEEIERREVDPYDCFSYLRVLMHQKNLLTHTKKKMGSLQLRATTLYLYLRIGWKRFIAFLFQREDASDERMREIRIKSERFAIDYLHTLVDNPQYPSEIVAKLLIGHERILAMLESGGTPTSRALEGGSSELATIQRLGLRIEQDVIADYYASGALSRSQAKDLRDNVSLMMIDLEEQL